MPDGWVNWMFFMFFAIGALGGWIVVFLVAAEWAKHLWSAR